MNFPDHFHFGPPVMANKYCQIFDTTITPRGRAGNCLFSAQYAKSFDDDRI
jgi:hypothetical protein